MFFSRPCLSTYFIKKKAVYRQFLMRPNRGLTNTRSQRLTVPESINMFDDSYWKYIMYWHDKAIYLVVMLSFIVFS